METRERQKKMSNMWLLFEGYSSNGQFPLFFSPYSDAKERKKEKWKETKNSWTTRSKNSNTSNGTFLWFVGQYHQIQSNIYKFTIAISTNRRPNQMNYGTPNANAAIIYSDHFVRFTKLFGPQCNGRIWRWHLFCCSVVCCFVCVCLFSLHFNGCLWLYVNSLMGKCWCCCIVQSIICGIARWKCIFVCDFVAYAFFLSLFVCCLFVYLFVVCFFLVLCLRSTFLVKIYHLYVRKCL